ncbi:MAG TPA: transporter substrate-binding domain-containing protein [Dongiaceae bacterium]|nr:transporter substrate-binding domain-containing protein [Dongiaceae bacterium]
MTYRLAALLILAAGLWRPTAGADARELRVIAEAFPTIAEKAPDGSLSGVGVEITRAIAAKLNLPMTITVFPWGRSLAEMQRGEADILIGPYPTPERAAYMDFSVQAIYRAKVVLFAPADKRLDWQGDFNKLAGLRIGTTLAWYYGANFERHRASLKLEETTHQPDAFQMLMHDRIDLVITTESAGQAAIDQLGLAGRVVELTPPVDILEGHIGFSKKPEMQAVREAFDRALDALVADGTVARINQRYGRFY